MVPKLIYSVDDVQNRCLFSLRARGQKRKSVNISDLRKFHVFAKADGRLMIRNQLICL